MSLWQFQACVDGWRRSHQTGDEKIEPPTADDFFDLVERYG